jgi:hypothetical protein
VIPTANETSGYKSFSVLTRELLDYYENEGLNVIPLIPGDKKPVSEWKEYQQRKITKEEINNFFLQGTQHNIGVVCGKISDNLYVLDFDTEEIFQRFFTKKDGLTIVKTGRGYHVYFKAESPVKTLSMLDSEGKEIATLKGEGSYVVGPPSLHPSGARYEFIRRESKIPRVSGDVRQQVKERAAKIGLACPKEQIDIESLLKGTAEGYRANSLVYLITFLRRAGINKTNGLEICLAWNKRNKPPLSQGDLRDKVDSYYRYPEPYHYFYTIDPGLWTITDTLTLKEKGKRTPPEEEPEIVRLSLEHNDKKFGILELETREDGMVVSIKDGDESIIPKAEKARNFYLKERTRDTLFKHVKQALSEAEYKDFLNQIIPQIEAALPSRSGGTAQRKEEEEKFKRKAHFELDGKLYLEILTKDEQYKFAYLNDRGDVELVERVEDIIPVDLLRTQEGELANIVKMPDEDVTRCNVLDAGTLLQKIKTHIQEYCDMAELDIELCGYYAMFTWFYKKTNTAGYLRFRADTGKGKTRMLSVIGDLCFYPTSAGGSSSFSGMMRTHERWHGTLLMDEADTSAKKEDKTIKYLNLGLEAGKYFILSDKKNPKYQEVFDPFGPKVIGMREHFKDNALEGRVLSISPYETTKEDIPILLDTAYGEKTRNLRNEIARFVLTHWDDVNGEKMVLFKGMGIEPRLQQLAMPLSIIFQLWEEGTEKFKSYIAARQKELKKDRAQSWEGSMFNLVYAIAVGDEDISDEFVLYCDPDGGVEAIAPSMVAKLLNTSTRAATDALISIGFDVERRYITLQQQIDGDAGKPKRRRTRAYVVPNGKTWREIVQRYYYSEDEGKEVHIEIPDILRSRKYVDSARGSVPTVPTVPHKEDGTHGTHGTHGTDTGTHNKKILVQDVHEEEQKTKPTKEKTTRTENLERIDEDGSIKRGDNPKTPSEEKIKDLEERFNETHEYKSDGKCEDCERLGRVFVHLIKKGEKKLLCAACLEKEINKQLDMSVESISADASPIGCN